MTALVEADRVTRRFGDLTAVDAVSLEVGPGEIVGLLGANGAGKTTLLKMVLGLLAPTAGEIRLFGEPPGRRARRRLGYVPQGLGLYDDLTVAENLAFAARVHGRSPARPPGATGDVLVADAPLGVRRRTAFGAATVHDPALLVLDEPTSGVGPLARAGLWETIHAAADGGVGVVVTTHYMDEAEQCDRLVVMARGRQVAAGTVQEVIGDIQTVEIEVGDVAGALGRLQAASMVALPAGHRLRIPGASSEDVSSCLAGEQFSVSPSPATLEEAFIALVGSA